MIVRSWQGFAADKNADAYVQHLRKDVLSVLDGIPGYQGIQILRRAVGDEVGFVVLTTWASMDAIRRFAGDRPEVAVVAPTARAVLSRWDEEVHHYEVVDSHDSGKRAPIDIAFTPAVKAIQERKGSRGSYARLQERGGFGEKITPDLAAFVAERDSFYLGTSSADGQPYIQHRGGPKGFLKILDDKTLAFADFGGNKQYISMGNLSENDRACLFLMDYPNRRRIKLWGQAEVVEEDADLLEKLVDPEYSARPERVFLFHVEAWDVNCPQHIKPRYTVEEFDASDRG